MSKGKLLMILLGLSLVMVLIIPQSNAWPSDDQGGPYYTMEIDPAQAPVIDGEDNGNEWFTEEEPFQDSYPALTYEDGAVNGLTISIVMLTDGQNLYVKVTYEEGGVNSRDQENSVGLAFAPSEIQGMSSTLDRKVAYWDGDNTVEQDLFNCQNYDGTGSLNRTAFCNQPGYDTPGAPDAVSDFDAAFGVGNGRGFFEFSIVMNSGNDTEDIVITEGTYIKVVVNPFDNIAGMDVGHAGIGSENLFIQYEPRCFFCQPSGPMSGNAFVFNLFFGILITGIYLTLIYAGRSESFASKLWKIDVSEDQAKESVVMEMAYYNSSFISILISAFFLMYSIIGLIYGQWANWGTTGFLIYAIPTVLGIYAIYDLVQRNENPQEMEGEKPGTDYNEAGYFWLVPTLFLAITLLMLVFIGIDVIA